MQDKNTWLEWAQDFILILFLLRQEKTVKDYSSEYLNWHENINSYCKTNN